MYIRPTWSTYKGKRYKNHVLVESVSTPRGPRQKHVCTLGDLSPRPRAEWLKLARKVEDALVGEPCLFEDTPDPEVAEIVSRVKARREKVAAKEPPSGDLVSVRTDDVAMEDLRSAGAVHVGYQFWRRLELDRVLAEAGLKERTRQLVCAMTLNRLVHPGSERAMPEWFQTVALDDILGFPCRELADDSLYRTMDRLYPKREVIERLLGETERDLFNLSGTIFLYDLTSSYFEGQALENEKAARGYSRDGRPDCKQVVVGLVIGPEGFPSAHEVFAGNTNDTASLPEMLSVLDKRAPLEKEQTVVIDRGIASAENLAEIRRRGLHYIVASRNTEREAWWDEFYAGEGFQTVCPEKTGSNVRVKKVERDGILYVLCESTARSEKDRGIRQRVEKNFLRDVEKLRKRITRQSLKEPVIQRAIGRLQERHSRVGRYYHLEYEAESRTLACRLLEEKRARAQQLDGCYILKTDRTDMDSRTMWRTYTLLTKAEAAFRAMKSPLGQRPIFHQLCHRVETHIFLCILAYHLLTAIETTLRDKGEHACWETIRKRLSSHKVGTVVLPTDGDMTLKIRKSSRPEPEHARLYSLLGVPREIIRPVKTWAPTVAEP